MNARIVTAALTVLLASPSSAQESVPAGEGAEPSTAGAGANEEQLAEAQKVVSRGTRLSSRVAGMKTEAERESDIMKVNCLNKTLAEINAFVRNASGRLDRLRGESDPDRVRQSMTVMAVYGQKFGVLDQQASQCIGENLFEVGSTKVETEIDNATVPTDEEAQTIAVPQVVPPPAEGEVQVEAPPTPEEASPNGDEG